MNKQLITIENRTSKGTISSKEFSSLVYALDSQAQYDFNRSPWVEHNYCSPAEVRALSESEKPPTASWNIILLNSLPAEDEDALGFHEDIDGGKIPVSYVGISESREDDTSINEVASHEMLEMLVDPFVTGNDIKTVKYENKEYIVEIADPVEGSGYHCVGEGNVANFVWPKWFGMEQTREGTCQFDYGNLLSPFQLAPNGYISSRPIGGGESSWSETFGYKRTELPKWANRLPRIKNAKVEA